MDINKKASSVFEEAFLSIAHYISYHNLELKSSNFFDTQYNGITGIKDPNARRL